MAQNWPLDDGVDLDRLYRDFQALSFHTAPIRPSTSGWEWQDEPPKKKKKKPAKPKLGIDPAVARRNLLEAALAVITADAVGRDDPAALNALSSAAQDLVIAEDEAKDAELAKLASCVKQVAAKKPNGVEIQPLHLAQLKQLTTFDGYTWGIGDRTYRYHGPESSAAMAGPGEQKGHWSRVS